jgi:hypothetical protein
VSQRVDADFAIADSRFVRVPERDDPAFGRSGPHRD